MNINTQAPIEGEPECDKRNLANNFCNPGTHRRCAEKIISQGKIEEDEVMHVL